MLESAVGAHLIRASEEGIGKVFYWRDGQHEVDFVFKTDRKLVAIEVKSGEAQRDFQEWLFLLKHFNLIKN